MRSRLIIFFLCSMQLVGLAQQKKWHYTYWLATQCNFIYGKENTLGYSIFAGKNLKKTAAVGLGYSSTTFNTDATIRTVELLGEIFFSDKNRQLFLQIKPGLNFIKNAKSFAEKNSFYEFEKAKTGTNINAGVGMRWFVKRHAFLLSIGVVNAQYSFTTLEYPLPIDPYNPFLESSLRHTQKYSHQKAVISLGVRF